MNAVRHEGVVYTLEADTPHHVIVAYIVNMVTRRMMRGEWECGRIDSAGNFSTRLFE